MAKKKNHKELMELLRENPPSEFITVTVVLDDENETEFNFTRSMDAYDRYLTTLIIDKKLLTAASVFLMDTVIPEEREVLAHYLSAYPNEAMKIVSHIADVYSGSIETKLKNA
jgi:hypothetical protein